MNNDYQPSYDAELDIDEFKKAAATIFNTFNSTVRSDGDDEFYRMIMRTEKRTKIYHDVEVHQFIDMMQEFLLMIMLDEGDGEEKEIEITETP